MKYESLIVITGLFLIILISGCVNDDTTGQFIEDHNIQSNALETNSDTQGIAQESIPIESPISVSVFVLGEERSNPIDNVKLFVDGSLKCTTNANGLCSFQITKGKYEFVLQGNGVNFRELKTLSETENEFTFPVERNFDITITITDEYNNNPVEEAKVYLDGVFKSFTSYDGEIKLTDVQEGSHSIEAEYKNIRKSKNIQVTDKTTSFFLSLKLPRTISIKILDSETGKPVGNEQVYIDGQYRGTTTQLGELSVDDVFQNTYRISLDRVEGIPSTTFTVKDSKDYYTINLDMPNPIFKVSAKMNEYLSGLNQVGKVDIEIYNGGEIVSEDTIAIVSVYQIIEDEPHLLSQDLVRFGGIATGEMKLEVSDEMDTSYWNQDDVVVVVFDRSDYIPEQEYATKLNLPGSFVDDVIRDSASYCSENAETCAKVSGIFVGTIIKTVIG